MVLEQLDKPVEFKLREWGLVVGVVIVLTLGLVVDVWTACMRDHLCACVRAHVQVRAYVCLCACPSARGCICACVRVSMPCCAVSVCQLARTNEPSYVCACEPKRTPFCTSRL